jgi:uncharacterized protein (DUF4415 family)
MAKKMKIEFGNIDLPEDFGQNVKERITIFLDEDIVDYFREVAKASGGKYQTLINKTLRRAVDNSKIRLKTGT